MGLASKGDEESKENEFQRLLTSYNRFREQLELSSVLFNSRQVQAFDYILFVMPGIVDELNSWHQRLHLLRVDLVGDYAGQELFFIDGDSLLRLVFSDCRIDMEDGFQLLHAVYVVECFLANLKKRKCVFHLVFFEENTYLCLPSGIPLQKSYKHLFARSAIIRHLSSTSKSSTGDDPFHVFCFQSPDDDDFQQYLAKTRPYFVMCHDGADTSENTLAQFLLKSFIWRMVAAGYNVALIDEVEFRDSKVMTTIVQGGSRTGFGAERVQETSEFIYDRLVQDSLTDLECDYDFPKIPIDAVSSERELIAVASVSAILQDSDLSTVEISYIATFILHIAFLNHLSLPQRSLESGKPQSQNRKLFDKIIQWIIIVSRSFLDDKSYQRIAAQLKLNIHDYIDGRLLRKLQDRLGKPLSLPIPVMNDFRRMAEIIEEISGCRISLPDKVHSNIKRPSNTRITLPNAPYNSMELAVLPFSNPTFDVFLSQIKLAVDSSATVWDVQRSKRFQETTHWHNRKPLDSKIAGIRAMNSTSKWLAGRAKRYEQIRFSRMTKYAASLVGVKGQMLEPIVITNSPESLRSGGSSERKISGQAGKKEKTKPKLMSKKDIIRAENNKKILEKGDLALQRIWQTLCREIQGLKDEEAKILKLDQFLNTIESTASEKGSIVEGEARLYKIWMLQRLWAGFCRANSRKQGCQVVAVIFDETRKVLALDGLTKKVHDILEKFFQALDIPMPPRKSSSGTLLNSKISFDLAWDGTSVADVKLQMTSTEFQLRHCGLYMDRNIDPKPDPRVSFIPDGWQRKVLDEVDRNNSVFVVAPTSAGKTFISFYAMEKVLRSGDEGVLVYVAPTKALVNQIAAEVMARFRKTYAHAGKCVWAIHTRDTRINNSTGCQILVTVPHILQIMLLSPSNANSWSRRVKRIIFDEIHCIGQAEDGVVWEQLLLLSPCPIIALSATVGNPEEFNSWMQSTQKSLGTKLTMVQHHHRHSDLRKILYNHPKAYKFTGLREGSMFENLEGSKRFVPMHPIASLVDSSRGIPDDLALEPRDCLSLYEAMKKHSTKKYQLKKNLNPEIFFAKSPVISKVDMIRWEAELKSELKVWMDSVHSPFNRIIRELRGQLAEGLTGFRQDDPHEESPKKEEEVVDEDQKHERALEDAVEIASGLPTLLKKALPMLDELNSRNALPAILFSYDRAICEKLCFSIWEQLKEAEDSWRKTSPEWAAVLRKWAEHIEAKNSRAAKKQAKAAARNEEGSKEERIRENATEGSSFFDSFNPRDPLPQFSFADKGKYSDEELKDDFKFLRTKCPGYLLHALRRGIGVHHAGLNRVYLHTVEMLFRKGYLRVVIATGTLSLGINMPCKTVVFAGDSVWLTALNFRQASGRAGRRGFDNLGNVVFLGIPINKARLLISSKLPSLMGHFPITTSLVLRLFNLLHDSKNSEHAIRAINGLLSQPRLYLGGDSFKEQVLHHLRFSIEYLRRQKLLGPGGEPLNFAGLTGHLYYTESSSFAFHALLRSGFFHSICANIRTKPQRTCRNIMLVMAHLFGRLPCKKTSPVKKLPPLPSRATAILKRHNNETLQIYTNYVKTFSAEHCSDITDNILPFSHSVCGQLSSGISQGDTPVASLPPVMARSSFVALSGLGDTFASISDLTDSVRAGIFLEKAAVPYVNTGEDVALNSYLLDFYRHGEVKTLIRQNEIRRSDVWFAFNNFSLVLATIVTSLTNFMACEDDDDSFDVVGLGDMEELDTDDETLVAVDDSDDSDEESEWGGLSEDETEVDFEVNGAGLGNVLAGFQMLKATFDQKFKAMWA